MAGKTMDEVLGKLTSFRVKPQMMSNLFKEQILIWFTFSLIFPHSVIWKVMSSKYYIDYAI
jgi:hypothetical protein